MDSMDFLSGTALIKKSNAQQLALMQATIVLTQLDLIVLHLGEQTIVIDRAPSSLLLESRKVTVYQPQNTAELDNRPQLAAYRERAKDLNIIDIDLAKMQVRTACNSQRHDGKSAREELQLRLAEVLGEDVDIDIQEVDVEELLSELDQLMGKVSDVAQERIKPDQLAAEEEAKAPLFTRNIALIPLEVRQETQGGVTLVVKELTLMMSEKATRFAQRLNEQREKRRDDEAHEEKRQIVKDEIAKGEIRDRDGAEGPIVDGKGRVVREEN